jgi:hypothetical protein
MKIKSGLNLKTLLCINGAGRILHAFIFEAYISMPSFASFNIIAAPAGI